MVSKSTLFKLGAVLSLGLALSACKAQVGTSVKLSDLQGDKMITGKANLLVEVAACNDFDDSRLPSNSLREAQEKVPSVVEGAIYKECYSERMDSWAWFKIPLAIIPKAEIGVPTNAIGIVSDQGKSLSVVVPEQISKRLRQMEKGSMMGDINTTVSIRLVNDTDTAYDYKATATWINDVPVVNAEHTLKPNTSMDIDLSDVSVGSAMQFGTAIVLTPR